MKFLFIFLLLPAMALAHEGHDALPTKGASVKGDRLMLSARAAKAIGLELGKVELAEVTRLIRAVGSIELPWQQQAYVSTLLAGRIEKVLVKPGESVSAGRELAQVSGPELESLQLTLLQAYESKALAERILAAQEAAGEGIANKVLLQTRAEAQQQSTQFDIAWQKLLTIGLNEASLERICDTGETVPVVSLCSPIAGVVARADVRAGQIVKPTDHLYHIVDPSRVWIVAKVLEADAGQVQVGLPVEAIFPALPGEVFKATIDHVELRLNRDRTLSIKAVCENPDGKLTPGTFGRVAIRSAPHKAVVCPADALIDGGFALVEQSRGNFVRKTVIVAAIRGQQAEIEDGLFPGDRVVTVGSHELASLFATKPASPPVRSVEGLTAQGQIELPTDQKTFASAPVEGRIRRILVEHGQRVRKGQVVAELDSLPLQNLQLDLRQARTNLAQATQELARSESLSDSLARKEIWQSQNRRDTLRQTVGSLEKQLSLLGAGGTESGVLPIRAPADGLICDFDLIPGQVVAPNDPLFELHNPTKVWAHLYLFEQDAAGFKLGQSVRIRLASDPSFRATGTIERLDPLLLAGSRAISVWTELENPNLQLKEGMAASVGMAGR